VTLRAEYLALVAAILCACGLALLRELPCEHAAHAVITSAVRP